MNPRALAIWSLGATTVALAGTNPVYRVVSLLTAIAVLATHSRRGTLRPVAFAIVASGLLAVAVNLGIGHTGRHVFASLPSWLPLLGGPLTVESLVAGGASALGLATAFAALAPLVTALEPEDLVDALPRPLHRTGVALAAALNMVPALGRSYTGIQDAQRLRGLGRGRLALSSVLVPTLLTAFEDSIDLAEAMSARAFASGAYTTMRAARWSPADIMVVAVTLLAVTGMIAGQLSGSIADWYPYPELTLPAIAPVPIALTALLVLPALVGPRSPAAAPA